METLSDEAATDRKTSFKEVAQAAQEQGLPGLDHARHFLAVFKKVPAAVVTTATSRRVYYVERPRL